MKHSMWTEIAILLIVGLICAIVGAYVGTGIGEKRERREVENRVKEFKQRAAALVQSEKYDEVRKEAGQLPDQVRNRHEVQSAIMRAEVLRAALEREVFGISEPGSLEALNIEAGILDRNENTAETAAMQGIIDSLLDNPTAALAHFAEAERRDSRYPQLYNHWGYALAQWKMPAGSESWQDAAEKKFGKALELAPQYEWPLINLGALMLSRVDEPTVGDYEAANRYFEKAAEIAPSNPNAYMNSAVCLLSIGRSLQEQGDRTKANEYFGQASTKLRKAYQDLGLDSAMLHLNWGYLFEITDNSEQALDHYERALQLKPLFFPACLNRSELLERLGRRESAKQSYLKCRETAVRLSADFSRRAVGTGDLSASSRLHQLSQSLNQSIRELDKKISHLQGAASASK